MLRFGLIRTAKKWLFKSGLGKSDLNYGRDSLAQKINEVQDAERRFHKRCENIQKSSDREVAREMEYIESAS